MPATPYLLPRRYSSLWVRDYDWIMGRGAPDWLAGNTTILLRIDGRQASSAAQTIAEPA